MPSSRIAGRSPAQITLRLLRAECATLYNKGYSAHAVMEESVKFLRDRGFAIGTNLHSRLLVAAWNLCNRPNTPSIHDQLANREQFETEDSPSLETPWWKLEY